MAICTSCGKESDVNESGLCADCARLAMRFQLSQNRPVEPSQSEKIDVTPMQDNPSLAGLTYEEQAYVRRQREELKSKIQAAIPELTRRGLDGYYEYKAINISDRLIRGTVDIKKINAELNELGLEGWHLVTAFSNDLGVNAAPVGGIVINRSVSQNILIFERFVKI